MALGPEPNRPPNADRPERVAPPCAVVIFGSTGDLSHRKLLPALYNLTLARLLPAGLAIVAFGRGPLSDADYRAQMKDSVAQLSPPSLRQDVWGAVAYGE